eukprot:m.13412 g.13412  ORF g.13412 m.13412 type:complete len:297 (-) comp9719_c0_seq1:315-1205(-)
MAMFSAGRCLYGGIRLCKNPIRNLTSTFQTNQPSITKTTFPMTSVTRQGSDRPHHAQLPQQLTMATAPNAQQSNKSRDAAGGTAQIPANISDELSWVDRIVKRVGILGGFYSKKQTISRSARDIYLECCKQAAEPELYKICGLPDTFQSWFLIQHLYVWMLCVRSISDGDEGKMFHKQLVQFFWQDVDHRFMLMNVQDITIKTESKRELSSMFYGLLFAYDEGLATDDQVLAAAVWRNLFHSCKAQAKAEDIALVVEYIRKQVYKLDQSEASTLLETGSFTFDGPPSPSSTTHLEI